MSHRQPSVAITQRVVATLIGLALAAPLSAQQVLEEITVTAQKREENIQEVPISISSLAGERLDSKFSGGETILALASAAPGLYAESSNGRHAPRFYMRGLGNADFDQAASQPVSIVFDEVAMEQVTLKSFPVFDLASVEVIRGPQGTLYGRNTTAGILKLNSRRPTQELDGYVKAGFGTFGTFNAEAAVGGGLVENTLSGRISLMTQNRDDWIDNGFTGQSDAIGGHEEVAGRIQLLWTPTDSFSALLLYQQRDLSGNSASAFRANIIEPGTNDLNSNFDREKIWYDGGGNNPASIESSGINLHIDWDIGDYTLTSITSFQDGDQFARGDIDGGIVDPTVSIPTPPGIQCVDAGFTIPAFGPARTCPDFIFISSDTGGNNDLEQFSQELRLASNFDGSFNYQLGAFFFDDELSTSTEFGIGPNPMDLFVASIAFHENTSWALFAQGDWDVTDRTTLTAGLRWSDDEKDYTPTLAPPTQAAINLSDDDLSGNISISYALNDFSQLYARVASGFRAPSIQARNAAFNAPVTTATSETILSFEVGYKAYISDRTRFNAAFFTYEIDDMQLTAIGGAGNFTTLLNADKGTGIGVEFDIDFAATENVILGGGFGYNDTEIEDSTLSIAPCAACMVTDPFDANGNAIIDGNPFQHAPEWTLNADLTWLIPLSSGNELFLFTDWKAKGTTNEFLYESIEFEFDTQYEGGLRLGYRDNINNWEVALFGRNITDEENPIGGIDFSNNTSYVNEPTIWGVEGTFNFGDN